MIYNLKREKIYDEWEKKKPAKEIEGKQHHSSDVKTTKLTVLSVNIEQHPYLLNGWLK